MSQSDLDNIPHTISQDENPAGISRPVNHSTKARNDQKWERYKDDIRHLYVIQGRPLRKTMQEIETRFQFKKSERNWKAKMREWGFDKNMTSNIKFMLSKAEKRAWDEGKETQFTRDGIAVPAETLEQIKRTMLSDSAEHLFPVVATPSNITYETPREESTGQPSSPESLPSSFDENNLFYIEHDDNLFKTPSQEQEGSALPTSPKPHTPFNDDGIDVNGHYIDELHIHTPVLDNTAGILISHDINANQDLGIISNADFILDNIPGELPILKGVSMVDDLSNLQPISLESYYHLAAHALEELSSLS